MNEFDLLVKPLANFFLFLKFKFRLLLIKFDVFSSDQNSNKCFYCSLT